MAKKKKKNPTHGGAREGSGRPAGEPTKTLAYRVPEKIAAALDAAIRNIIKRFLNMIL